MRLSAGLNGAYEREIRMSEKSSAGFFSVSFRRSFRVFWREFSSQFFKEVSFLIVASSRLASSVSENFFRNLLFSSKSRLTFGSVKK